jgi:hypothetical protein
MEAALEACEASHSAVAMINRLGEVIRLNRCAKRLLVPDLQIVCRRVSAQAATLHRRSTTLYTIGSGDEVRKRFTRRLSCRDKAAVRSSRRCIMAGGLSGEAGLSTICVSVDIK